jgi:pyruvate carboxylase
MKLKKILVANRGEIAIRVMRAAKELNIRTVGIFSNEDRLSLHRFEADESHLIGAGKAPVAAYLDIAGIVSLARQTGADAVHPGYGFLSENPEFARACTEAGIAFIGPDADVMVMLGNKVAARALARSVDVPVMPASEALRPDMDGAVAAARAIGYPLMLKASWGGGGRGMRVIDSEASLRAQVDAARREATAAFGNGELYLEKLVRRARHIEVQIVGDKHGNHVHLYERDCSVQRRHQKVVECAPAPDMAADLRERLCEAALRLAKAVRYTHAGTVEFLVDDDSGSFYFIEVNPRIQVEHTVTEQVTGIDLVKAQIQIAQGARIGAEDCEIPEQQSVRPRGYAIQCRITAEDPERGFAPTYGRIAAFRSPEGFGIRVDRGTAYAGAVVSPHYDSLLVKVTASASSFTGAIARMDRALRELQVHGVKTNIGFLRNVVTHPVFGHGKCLTSFIDTTPGLFSITPGPDASAGLLQFIAEVSINGNPEVKGGASPVRRRPAVPLAVRAAQPAEPGTRDLLRTLGPEAFKDWIAKQKRVLITDTTMRDAHQSLFATRMRTFDMLAAADYYASAAGKLFSLECWGGATFDVAMRFLKEDPWERLTELRKRVPNILFQMLLRGSNAVGYKHYPQNVIEYFIRQSASSGIDLFRVFDSMNSVDSMRIAIDAVRAEGALCEGAICYTGDLFDARRSKYDLKYYIGLAKQLQHAGVHILAIKDMAGLCRPQAARVLVRALKEETGLPVHFHTHDTAGTGAASVLAAIDGGASIVDAAMDSMSGLTSQPSMGGLVAVLAGTQRDTELDAAALQNLSAYWERVRSNYEAFESDLRAGTSSVYQHEIPGGQYSNLREQARAMGLEARWPEVAQAYADANQLCGDIVKVTPTSKVVGDMALFMVANGYTPEQVASPQYEMTFPDSVVSLFKGDLGFPPEGFPASMQQKVLGLADIEDYRPEPPLPPADLEALRAEAAERAGEELSDRDLASFLMYPSVFIDFVRQRSRFGAVSALPTEVFFYGVRDNEEIEIADASGRTTVLKLRAISEPDAWGDRSVIFEVNGQPWMAQVAQAGRERVDVRKAEVGNSRHVAAPMSGRLVEVMVSVGDSVQEGTPLFSMEAMKMESTVCSSRAAVVAAVHARAGSTVEAGALLLEFDL